MFDVLLPAGVLTALGVFFGVVLSWAGNVFKIKRDPRALQITDVLPGANCGACGYPGCEGLAEAISSGEASVNDCPVGGEASARAAADIMGVAAGKHIPMVTAVICQGARDVCKPKFTYEGLRDCRAAALAGGGGRACRHACLGMGTCAHLCPFNAIEMINGIAHISPEKCTACGLCIASCPKGVLRLLPREREIIIRCRAVERGKAVHDACSAGCISCSRCFKACNYGAITMTHNLPSINFDLCTQCGDCAAACPTGAMSGGTVNPS